MRSSARAIGLALWLLVAAACIDRQSTEPVAPPIDSTPVAPEPEPIDRSNALRLVPLEELPLLLDDGAQEDIEDGSSRWQSLRQALERSRRWFANRPADQRFLLGPRPVTASGMLAGIERMLELLADEPTAERLAVRVAHEFELYESVGSPDRPQDRPVLVTGYYEPVIDGSRQRSEACQVPVYGPPGERLVRVDLGAFDEKYSGQRIAGLVKNGKLVPFPDRAEIRQQQTLRGREIAWACDTVDLFFIEIQGSGALRFADGSEMRIGYAGANGRPYRSIGKLLIDEGLVPREQMSMQAIRRYLQEHPEDIERVLDHNPSFVFFRKLNTAPVGSLGLPVTPQRSIATDHRLFPKGALGFLISERPGANIDPATGVAPVDGQISRFVLNQDTGGAIRGAHRVDFFWGRGADAAARAGVMKHPGRLFFLAPRRSN